MKIINCDNPRHCGGFSKRAIEASPGNPRHLKERSEEAIQNKNHVIPNLFRNLLKQKGPETSSGRQNTSLNDKYTDCRGSSSLAMTQHELTSYNPRHCEECNDEAIYCQTQTTPCHAELVSASQTLNENRSRNKFGMTACNPRHCERSEAIQNKNHVIPNLFRNLLKQKGPEKAPEEIKDSRVAYRQLRAKLNACRSLRLTHSSSGWQNTTSRRCERSEAIHRPTRKNIDCRVAINCSSQRHNK